jgi:copper chaperone NosL
MNRLIIAGVAGISLAIMLGGCGSESDDGPPDIRYGDAVCAECGMIVSDERFATAIVINGDRGFEPLVFDDFNCQLTHETKHPELDIVARWSHDYQSFEWLPMRDAWFIKSEALRTPMASHIATFSSEQAAREFSGPIDGAVSEFDEIWGAD